MSIKRRVVVVFLLALLVGTATPLPARADAVEVLVIAGAVTAAYVAVVMLATAWVYRTPPASFAPASVEATAADQSRHGVRLAPACVQTSPNLTFVCW